MAGPVTEITYLTIGAGVDPHSPESSAIIKESLDTVAAQKGCSAVYYGQQIEHPETFQLAINWDSLASHEAFKNSPSWPSFVEKMTPLLGAPPKVYHLSLLPHVSDTTKPLSAPVTECISLFFEPSYPAADYEASFAKFGQEAKPPADADHGLAVGWGVEDGEHPDLGKAKVFGGFVGWASLEAHEGFRNHPDFKLAVKYLNDGPKAVEMHHVAFKKH